MGGIVRQVRERLRQVGADLQGVRQRHARQVAGVFVPGRHGLRLGAVARPQDSGVAPAGRGR
ncbi:Uncharacterised protein [Bordetella pertussis]|nr:Uncharacterised protein [Bordetella pertussis]